MEHSKPIYTVTNDKEHAALLKKVDLLMKKGEQNTTDEENGQILAMGEAIMAYEQSIYEIPEISSLEGILELRMYEFRLEGKDLAQTLDISQEELEMILWEDQKADNSLLEQIKEKLDIAPEIIANYIGHSEDI